MDQARGKKRRPEPRLSLLGDGLLERVRSTSFALLGLVTAVCLGIVALTVNQDWPSIVESPIPALPSPAAEDGNRETTRRGGVRAGRLPAEDPAERGSGTATVAGELGGTPSPTAVRGEAVERVVSASIPVGGDGDRADGGGRDAQPAPPPSPAPAPVSQPVSETNPESPSAPPVPDASPPAPPPAAVPAPAPSPPTAASGPPGKGNAYGWENGKAKGHDR